MCVQLIYWGSVKICGSDRAAGLSTVKRLLRGVCVRACVFLRHLAVIERVAVVISGLPW